jgi:hypothetical protein
MVHVEVGNQQVVDLRYPRVARRRNDPVRIASRARIARLETRALPRPSGVDEEGVTLRRDDERRLAPLDVDEINLERPVRLTR